MKKIAGHKSQVRNSPAFTLTELLIVIAIMGVIAGFTLPVLKMAKAAQYKKVARGELEFIETALESYKAKYGVYPPGNASNPLLPQLYYELAGTIQTTIAGVNYFLTLDGNGKILVTDVPIAYGVGGFVNCTKGGGVEDAASARNFLSGLSGKEINNTMSNGVVANTSILITSVGGPDTSYQPLKVSGVNPFRYVYPGVNNPGSYDLWVQLVISGQTNLICNWSRQVQINSPLP